MKFPIYGEKKMFQTPNHQLDMYDFPVEEI
jgi:hypothetical protein